MLGNYSQKHIEGPYRSRGPKNPLNILERIEHVEHIEQEDAEVVEVVEEEAETGDGDSQPAASDTPAPAATASSAPAPQPTDTPEMWTQVASEARKSSAALPEKLNASQEATLSGSRLSLYRKPCKSQFHHSVEFKDALLESRSQGLLCFRIILQTCCHLLYSKVL